MGNCCMDIFDTTPFPTDVGDQSQLRPLGYITRQGNDLYTHYQSKNYCPVLVAQEGSALWGNTLATALLHDQNRTIPFGLMGGGAFDAPKSTSANAASASP